MDAVLEDDICILNHEKAHRRETVTPVSIYSGDESVASHFALVTAYEDIKKRLKDSEKENSFLKKRIRFLEEKLVGARLDEETSSVGREQVNKAYHAYREVCIDRDNLKSKLDKMNKDNSESLKILNEQLQSKEVELLQLRTEVETQQVMRNLNPPSSNWEVEKLSCDLKIHGLEQELELMRRECNSLKLELQKTKQMDSSQEDNQNRDFQRLSISSDNMQHTYWELKKEMSNLHLVTQVQAEILRKLRTPTGIKKACAPVGCAEDLGKDSTKLFMTNFTATYKRHPPLSPNGKSIVSSPSPGDIKVLSEKAFLQSWTDNERSIPNDGTEFQEHNSYGRNSLEDNSWVFPSPPKSSETTFGDTKNKTLLLPNLPPLHYLDKHNQNCLYKN
ncbi:PREDICTED: 5-azacytidine-induced protein 2 isoform X1 [Dipodomys ordii]|uniref:5-azacytidine-induced protein 2 n=1 Tax=Dipodomys ordii TaxID=10020 RepID=A0A1S3G545_DIPOR|nr:PREDICTED: 5-azacytidine-induced protein 2 isoform X1 [Dipodomys ordii]XP_012883937.1 PREDICTED: 5-azacytidine-induced protein 2 isoform X1 [Dipodomys ordii]